MLACTKSVVLCTQHRWCRVPGKTCLGRLLETERAVAHRNFRAIRNPRCLTSIRSSRQRCALSRIPI